MNAYRIRNRSVITGFSFGSMFFLGLGVAIVGAAAQNAGIRAEQVGYLLAVQHLGFFGSVAFAGILADRYSKPAVLSVGSVLLAAGFAGFYAWDPFWLNLFFMLLTGFGIGAYEGVTDVLLLELHESRKSLFVNLNHFFVTLGSLVITVYLIFLNLSWRSSMVQAALVLIVLTFLYGITALPQGEGRKDSGPGDAAYKMPLELLRRPALGLLLVSIIAAVGIELGTIGILTSYLVELRGFTEVSSKVALILFLGGFGLGRITLAAVIRDSDVEIWIVTLLGASAVTTLLLYAVQPAWLLYTVSALSGLSVSVILPSIITAAAKQFPDQAGTAIGIIKMGIPVGGMVVPLLVSILTKVFSLQAALLVFPVVAAIGIAAVLAVLRTNVRSVAR